MKGRTTITTILDGLDARLTRLGLVASSLALTVLAVTGAVCAHILIRAAEGQPFSLLSVVNIMIVATLVALPLIFYARRVIGQLDNSRRRLQTMTRQLEVAADEAHNANRAKSAFLANMSHELRTPLNAILGFSEIMKDQHMGPVNNPRYLSYAHDIHSSGRYLLGIINDILDLSKIEAGKMSLDSAEEFALAPTLEASLGMVTGLASKYGVVLTADTPNVRLVAVERMVRQIFINLVGNAIKFTPAGGTVHVSGFVTGDDGYVVTVRDSGIGMNEEEMAKAVMPFGQVTSAMSAKHNGTGLGLPLAKAMMELHDGTLSIASATLEGTTVTLRFPPSRVARDAQSAAA